MEKNICIAILLLYGLVIILRCYIVIFQKDKKPKNKVHFYVARDKNDELFLYIGKPFRSINKFHPYQNGCIITSDDDLSNFGVNKDDYANLKWEDEPVEVFVNMEDRG